MVHHEHKLKLYKIILHYAYHRMHVVCSHLFLASKVGYHMENCVIIMLTMFSEYMDIGSDEKQSSSG